MNDYYRIDFTLSPASEDACALLADSLAAAGAESFEPDDSGAAMSAYVPATAYTLSMADEAIAELPFEVDVKATAELVVGCDWNVEWERNYFKPIVVDEKVVVHSSFHTDVPAAPYDIVIDPRMAFGTGHHATTTLMMRSLLNADLLGKKVIDMGTGTGILSILASMLGASAVVGIEIDPFAAENACDNVALNHHEDCVGVEIITGDASSLSDIPYCADIFLANINRNIITADISAYAEATAAGGMLTVSGFYVADRPVVQAAAVAAGFEYVGADERDNWSSMTFRKV